MDRATAVIDLGTMRHEPSVDPGPTRPFGPRRVRAAALALTGALLLGAAGDVPPSPRQWEVRTIPLSVGAHFRLTPERLFVTDPTPGSTRRVTAYDVTDGRRLWTSEPRPGHRLLDLTATPELVLLLDGDWENGPIRTTALDAGTGQWRWSVPNPLGVLPGERTALEIEDVFPPGSRIDPQNPPPEAPIVYPSSTGGLHSRKRIGVTVRAIDLDSGRVSWSASDLIAAVRVPAAADRPAMVLVGRHDGGIEARDLHTGAVRQRVEGAAGPLQNAWLVDGTLLIRHADGLSGYSADLRQRRWTRALPPESSVYPCGPMLCLHGPIDIQLLDPATGAFGWRLPSGTFLAPNGDHLIETDHQGRTNRAVDPRTGRTLINLAGWTGTAGYEDQAPPLLLLRRNGTALRTWLALLAPDALAVHPLDPVPYALSDCQAVAGAFACRTHRGDIRLWHYR